MDSFVGPLIILVVAFGLIAVWFWISGYLGR